MTTQRTTLSLSEETADRLYQLSSRKESYDETINRLIDANTKQLVIDADAAQKLLDEQSD